MFHKINIQQELEKVRGKSFNENDLLKAYQKMFFDVDVKRETIISTLQSSNNVTTNHFDLDILDRNSIFHINDIKKICANYRLRFLDSCNFIEQYPAEAISKIRDLEHLHNTKLGGFKIMAPYEAFKLKKADDPLLLAPIGNGYYYLIHKWGNDLHPLRKFKFWSFKNIDNLLIAMTIFSIVCTWLTYPFFIKGEPSFGYLLMLFMFFFKGVVGMFFIIFGPRGKNFSEYSWQSQYDKIR